MGSRIILLKGIGVSPRVGFGQVSSFTDTTHSDDLKGRVVVIGRVTPDIVPYIKGAKAVIADKGGITSHAANLLREFHVPCVVGTNFATELLEDGDVVTVDGWKGLVYYDVVKVAPEVDSTVARKIPTSTRIMVSIEVPETALEVAPLADGVSSFRNDYLLLKGGVHPRVLMEKDRDKVERLLYHGIKMVAEAMGPKPVWYKSLDAPTDEFRRLKGGEDEPLERNPLFGWRGIIREIDDPHMLETEYTAVGKLVDEGIKNLGIKVPFIRNIKEFIIARQVAEDCGLLEGKIQFGASVETPAMALMIRKIIKEGPDFISVGLNDLTMGTLAADRGNELISGIFDMHHPAVERLLGKIADTCRDEGVFSCICGRIGQDEIMLKKAVRMGFDAVGISPSYIIPAMETVAREETRIIRSIHSF